MEHDEVVITGLGCITPLGNDVDSTWKGLVQGRSAIGPIKGFNTSGFPCNFGAEVNDVTPPSMTGRLSRWRDKKTDFALHAAHEAITQAQLIDHDLDSHRIGVSVGAEASRPPVSRIAESLNHLRNNSASRVYRSVSPKDFLILAPSFPATAVANLVRASGPNLTTSTACTSSAQAIGDALRVLRRGQADIMVAGGTDRLVEELMLLGFSLLGALSTRTQSPKTACRPFDRTRDGFVLGEGSGVVVLERAEHAQKRGAKSMGRLLGYGCSSNAWRITDSPPDGRGAALAMCNALKDGKLTPESIDYINAHGTSTPQNDVSESAAIHRAFGSSARNVAISSTKSMMGHLVAACGAVELIVCLKAIQENIAPPTINYRTPDPLCDLDYVPNKARSMPIEYAMTNAFGFGGSNGTLVVGGVQ